MPFLKKPEVFYGYWIVAATFLCTFIWSGCGFYAFSLFVKPLQVGMGWNRGEIMIALTLWFLIAAVASPFVGRMVDRHGARKVITIGAITGGLGFISLSLMNNLWHFYIGYIVVGCGAAAAGAVPATAVVSNWFEKRRGTAIGITSIGVGGGGFVMAPIIGGYLIPHFGWRVAYLVLALLLWTIIIPLAQFVIKTKPADKGLYPDGVESPVAGMTTGVSFSSDTGLTLRMAFATSTLWLIIISFWLNSLSHVSAIQSQVPHLEDIGFPVVIAAMALGGIGLASAMAKFVFGWMCDYIPAKYAVCIGLGFQLVGIILLINLGPASPPAQLWLYTVIMGFGSGSWLPTMSMLVSTSFGLAAYGAIFGVVSFAFFAGSGIGPLIAGYMHDAMNTYYWAFVLFAALYVITIPTTLAIRRPKLQSGVAKGV